MYLYTPLHLASLLPGLHSVGKVSHGISSLVYTQPYPPSPIFVIFVVLLKLDYRDFKFFLRSVSLGYFY